ncbi:hypothetical protein, partial [Enterococcus faecalis]|uniref:hypothetical protein n=1 Tax=Enterococcus faecalis TaxID=1351 RepID=UPI003CC68776
MTTAPKTLSEGERFYADNSKGSIIGQGDSSSLKGYNKYSADGNRLRYIYSNPTVNYNGEKISIPNAFVTSIGQEVKNKEAGIEIHSLGIQLSE